MYDCIDQDLGLEVMTEGQDQGHEAETDTEKGQGH